MLLSCRPGWAAVLENLGRTGTLYGHTEISSILTVPPRDDVFGSGFAFRLIEDGLVGALVADLEGIKTA